MEQSPPRIVQKIESGRLGADTVQIHHSNIGRRLGQLAEKRFFSAWQERRHEPWLSLITKATADQDREGIDAIAETTSGKIYIQIKSGKSTRRRRYARRGIVVVKIKPSDDYETIRRKTIAELLRHLRQSPDK